MLDLDKVILAVIVFLSLSVAAFAENANPLPNPQPLIKLKTEIAASLKEESLPLLYKNLQLENYEMKKREIYYFDTEKLDLYNSNLILRARIKSIFKGSVTVKLRPLNPKLVPPRFFSMKGFKCERDLRVNGGDKISCSLKRKMSTRIIKEYVGMGRNIWDLFTADQHSFIFHFLPETLKELNLKVIGPVKSHYWDFFPGALGIECTADYWVLPSGTKILELSTRFPMEEEEKYISLFEDYLQDKQIELTEKPISKTSVVLKEFINDL